MGHHQLDLPILDYAPGSEMDRQFAADGAAVIPAADICFSFRRLLLRRRCVAIPAVAHRGPTTGIFLPIRAGTYGDRCVCYQSFGLRRRDLALGAVITTANN